MIKTSEIKKIDGKIANVVMLDITTQSYLGMHFYPMTLLPYALA